MTALPKISTIKRTSTRTMSPETRQRMSELAKKRHREGTWGSPEARAKAAATRRRNRKKTAADHVAEAAELHAKDIVEVFRAAIDAGQPMGTRLKAAQAWLEVEQDNRKLEMQEEAEEAKQHSRDELIAILADKLTAGPTAEILRRQLEQRAGIVDGTVVAEDVDVVDSTAAVVG